MYIYVYIHIYECVYVYIYIYINQRNQKYFSSTHNHRVIDSLALATLARVCIHVYTYIYVDIRKTPQALTTPV